MATKKQPEPDADGAPPADKPAKLDRSELVNLAITRGVASYEAWAMSDRDLAKAAGQETS